MSRNHELELEDMRECTHEPETAVGDSVDALQWFCRCGHRVAVTPPKLADVVEIDVTKVAP